MQNPTEEAMHARWQHFVHRYRAIHKIAQKAELEIERATAPRFSVFSLFGLNENTLSGILADFLNPKGSHGQGTFFLAAFIELLNRKTGHHLIGTGNLEATLVQCEVATSHIQNTQRRMDILLEHPEWVLAIESKPWAWEQEEQLADYGAHLDKKYPHLLRHLLFLSGSHSPPKTNGERNVLVMGFQREANDSRIYLSDWLLETKNRCQVDKIRHFLNDFILWVSREFTSFPGE